jgi:hypothetical protein
MATKAKKTVVKKSKPANQKKTPLVVKPPKQKKAKSTTKKKAPKVAPQQQRQVSIPWPAADSKKRKASDGGTSPRQPKKVRLDLPKLAGFQYTGVILQYQPIPL